MSITEQGNFKIIELETIALMEAFEANFHNQTVFVKSYDTPASDGASGYVADGGGGEFYWDSASTLTTDFGTIFYGPDGSGTAGRWKRKLTGETINARWFGVNGTTDKVPLGYAASYCATNTKTLKIDLNCAIEADLTIATGCSLVFEKLGKFTVASSKTVTIYAPENIQADLNNRIFDGSGDVVFSVGGTISSMWFGFGDTGNSAAENSTAIANAFSSLTTNTSYGTVNVPYIGTIEFTTLEIPAKCKLVGLGKYTTVLQSTYGGNVVTVNDDVAIHDLKLDGVSKETDSIGVYGIGKNRTQLDNVVITMFETGEKRYGCIFGRWDNVYWDSNYDGFWGRGDTDSSTGAGFNANLFQGCRANSNERTGFWLQAVDRAVQGNDIQSLDLEGNSIGMRLLGVRVSNIAQIWFEGNTTDHLLIDDGGTGLTFSLAFKSCVFNNCDDRGVYISGSAQDVTFDSCELYSHLWTVEDSTLRPIELRNCYITAGVVITDTNAKVIIKDTALNSAQTTIYPDPGDGNRKTVEEWYYGTVIEEKSLVYRETTDATVTSLWAQSMANDRIIMFKAKVFAQKSDNTEAASYELIGLFTTAAGAITQIGSTTVVSSIESDAALACILDTSGAVLRVRVTGIAAETYTWYCHVELSYRTLPS